MLDDGEQAGTVDEDELLIEEMKSNGKFKFVDLMSVDEERERKKKTHHHQEVKSSRVARDDSDSSAVNMNMNKKENVEGLCERMLSDVPASFDDPLLLERRWSMESSSLPLVANHNSNHHHHHHHQPRDKKMEKQRRPSTDEEWKEKNESTPTASKRVSVEELGAELDAAMRSLSTKEPPMQGGI